MAESHVEEFMNKLRETYSPFTELSQEELREVMFATKPGTGACGEWSVNTHFARWKYRLQFTRYNPRSAVNNRESNNLSMQPGPLNSPISGQFVEPSRRTVNNFGHSSE